MPIAASAHRPRRRTLLVPALALLPALAACGGEAGGGADRGDDAAVAFGALDTLPAPAGAGSAEPNLATAPDGRVWLSWLEPGADSAPALRVASLGAGDTAWSAAHTVVADRTLFVNWADFPSVLPLGEGRLVAHWLQRNGGGRSAYDVRMARSADDGATWSAPVVPHTDGTPTEHGFVALWPAGGDSVAALWLDGRKYAGTGGGHDGHGGGEMTLRAAHLAADGGIGAEQELDARTCDCCQTSAALTSRGPVVVYRDRSAEEIRDISAARFTDGRWSAPTPVHADGWEIAACPVNGPAIAARDERAVVAWFTGAQDTARVRVAFSGDAGATWGAAARADDGTPVGRVDVELLDDGSAALLWLERTGGEGAAVRLRRVAADGTLGPALTVAESQAARSAGFPRMARSGDVLYLSWTEPGTPSRVRVARVHLAAGAADAP